VSITPAIPAKCIPIKWVEPLPICTYPSRNIINGFNGKSNINPFLRNHVGVTVPVDAPFQLRMETATYFPTQFEINELEEVVKSNIDTTKWLLLIYETPTISDLWIKFLTDYYRSGRRFESVVLGLIQTPEVAMEFSTLATDIIVGNDYTEPDKIFSYPIASLIMNIIEGRKRFSSITYPRIIAFDEELESIEGIIKALVLGADSVMHGKMIIKAAECFGEVFKLDSGDLIRFTDEELPEGIVNTLNSSSLKKYNPYRYINPDTKAYEVTYNLEEMTSRLRKSLNEVLSTTGSNNILELRNNINVIIT
jgi:hypothetical protein